jgi:hypothetical protein
MGIHRGIGWPAPIRDSDYSASATDIPEPYTPQSLRAVFEGAANVFEDISACRYGVDIRCKAPSACFHYNVQAYEVPRTCILS